MHTLFNDMSKNIYSHALILILVIRTNLFNHLNTHIHRHTPTPPIYIY